MIIVVLIIDMLNMNIGITLVSIAFIRFVFF